MSSENRRLDLSAILEGSRENQSKGSGSPNILDTLLTIQKALGHVPPAALPEIAKALNVTQADVGGVLSFYPDLRTRPVGRHVVRVCIGESCLANHGDRVMTAMQRRLSVNVGESTQDGRFTLERVYCVGNCAVSPTVAIDEDLHGRVSEAGVESLLEPYG